MVDKPKLDQMLANLKAYVGELRRLAAVPAEEFLNSADMIGNAKYHFVIAIECCIDLANHVIASENYRFPHDNADSFSILGEQGIVEAAFGHRLGAMARFRNRLVHLYWDVDDHRVFSYLHESVSDLEDFAQAIAGHNW